MNARAVLVLAALALPRPAAADDADPADLLSRAQEQILRLDFERAIQFLEKARAAGGNPRDRLLVILRSLAESRAAIGQTGRAELDFRSLLALEPRSNLPTGSSPKLTAPFEAARDFMRAREPLAIQCEARGKRALLRVLSDPTDLVAAGRLTEPDGTPLAGADKRAGTSRIPLELPADTTSVACAALDRFGNQLALAALGSTSRSLPTEDPDMSILLPPGEIRRAEPPKPARPPRRAARPPPPQRPLYMRWWIWGGGAVVTAGFGGYWALRVQEDEDQWRSIVANSRDYEFAEAEAVRARGERHARYTNIAFGVAAALTAVSVGFLVYDVTSADDGDEGDEIRVGAAPLPGGAAATLQLRF